MPHPEPSDAPFPSFSHSESVEPFLLDVLQDHAERSAEYYLQLGNHHYNSYLQKSIRSELDSAISHYRSALEVEPNLVEGYVKLASALWDKGDISLDSALNYCKEALSLIPENGSGEQNAYQIHFTMGCFLQRASQWAVAQEHFKIATQLAPLREARPRIFWATSLIKLASTQHKQPTLKRLAQAGEGVTQFGLALLTLPFSKTFISSLCKGIAVDIQAYSVLALGKLLETIHLSSESQKIYHWATRQIPAEPIFYHLLADAYSQENEHEQAIGFYQKALRLDPNNVVLRKKLGHRYLMMDDTENAVNNLEKVVRVNENDLDALYQLGRIYADREEYIRALYYLKESASRLPENPYIHSHMAFLLFKLQDFTGAIEEYKLAIEHGEDPIWTATVCQTLGVLYYQVEKNIPDAIRYFQMAYQLEPNNLDCLTTLADLYSEQGDLASAIETYQFIIQLQPDNADCYSYLGYLQWQAGENEPAISAYQKAITLDPSASIAYNNLGVIYLDEQCQCEKAYQAFEQALTIKADYTLACFNLGRAQEAMGKTVEAANTYTRALSLNTDNPEMTDVEILERLDGLFRV